MASQSVTVQLEFNGEAALRLENGGILGGVVAPNVAGNLDFTIHREVIDEDGYLNPIANEPTVDGAFQINITGNASGYRELARYLLALAELDTSIDPDFHEHHDEIKSGDGRTQLHIICRKSPDASVA